MPRARRFALMFLAGLLAGLVVHESGRPLVNAAAEPGPSDDATITVDDGPKFAIDLNGSGAFVTMGPASTLGAAVFTLEAWIRREGAGVATTTGTGGVTAIPIVAKGMHEVDGDNRDMNYFLGIDRISGVLAADFEEGAAGTAPGLNHPIRGTTVVSLNEWHHVAVTYNGTWRLFLDGEPEALVGTAVVNQPPRADSIQHAAIGSALNSTGGVGTQVQGFFNGVIDEVRIWGVARSLDEIRAGMSTEHPLGSPVGTPPPASTADGLLGQWSFNEGAGTTAVNGVAGGPGGTAIGTFGWNQGGAPLTPPNNAPDVPVLVDPQNGATGVELPATLTVSVTDPDANALTVTYYGRPKSTASHPDFTLMTIPGTRHYVADPGRAATFTQQTNWIADNVAALNIKFTSHLGDIVDNQDRVPAEWARANTSMTVLDVNKIPYGVSPGDHDQTPDGTALNYDLVFPPSRYIGTEWYAGYLGAEVTDPIVRLNKDSYELFSGGGLDFLVIHVEHDWPGYAVTWANRIIKRYPNRRVILSTHVFLNEHGQRPTTSQFRGVGGTSAETVWQNLIRTNCNVFMVINGHFPGEAHRTDLNNCNQPVHQVAMDYQSRADGGDGWLRYFVFKPLQNQIAAFTYSPKLDAFETDANSQFALDYDMNAANFLVIATATNVASGSESTATWPGLEAGAAYEWYATVSDGKKTTIGPIWSFTTAAPNATPVAGNDTYTVDEDTVSLVPAPGLLGNDTDADGHALSAVLVSGPTHGSLNLDADGGFRYEPAGNYYGSDSFTYKATDGTAESNVATVAITVRSVNDAPRAMDDAFGVDEDQPLTVGALGVLANDSDEDGTGLLKAVLVTGARDGKVTLNEDGGFTYTANADFNGADGFSYQASDGEALSNIATVTITVNAVNDAPVASSQSVTTESEEMIAVTLAARDQEGSALTYRIVSGPTSGSLIGTAPDLRYTPDDDFIGADGFTFVANDGLTDSNLASVSIQVVREIDVPPVAFDQSVRTDEDKDEDIELRAVDPNRSAVLEYVIVSGPSHGTVSGVGRDVTYTPEPNFNGQDSFTFKASDSVHESNVAKVTITVRSVNDEPEANDQRFATAGGTPVTGMLAATDVDTVTLRYDLLEAPRNGTVTIDPATGSFIYTPSSSRRDDDDRFTWMASDGRVSSDDARVTIRIESARESDRPRDQPSERRQRDPSERKSN